MLLLQLARLLPARLGLRGEPPHEVLRRLLPPLHALQRLPQRQRAARHHDPWAGDLGVVRMADAGLQQSSFLWNSSFKKNLLSQHIQLDTHRESGPG